MKPPIVIDTPEKAGLLLGSISEGPDRIFGIDCETIGIDPRKEAPGRGHGRIFCWSLAVGDQRYYLTRETLEIFGPHLEHMPLVGHNIFGFDYHLFLAHGIQLKNIVADTLRMSKLAYNHPDAKHGLKHLAKSYLGLEMADYKDLFSRPGRLASKEVKRESYKEVKGVPTLTGVGELGRFSHSGARRELISLDSIPELYPQRMDTLVDYASLDAIATLQLYHKLKGKLEDLEWKNGKTLMEFYDTIWNPSLYCLTEAERNGFTYDTDVAALALDEINEELTQLRRVLDDWTEDPEFNFQSPKQLVEFLYYRKGYVVPPISGSKKAVKRTKRGEYPTSEAALDWLAKNSEDGENFVALLRYRKLLKERTRLDTFGEHLDEQGRIHYSLGPSTDTGRLAARNIPIQQIPKEGTLRTAFKAAEGKKLIVADYSQLELYILAHFLQVMFKDDKLGVALTSGDVHQNVADELGLSRDYAKAVVYSINYLKSARGLAAQLGIEEYEAQGFLDALHEKYPSIGKFQKWCEGYANRTGTIRTLLGRYRIIPEIEEQIPYLYAAGVRKACNTPVQGSAADLVTMAMLRTNTLDTPYLRRLGYVNEELKELGVSFLCQVHDELIFEVPERNVDTALPLVRAAMEHPFDSPLSFGNPVNAEIADTWAEGK